LDERNGIPLANLMCQKGYENIYLLSSGLFLWELNLTIFIGVEGFLEQYPQYVEGKKVPVIVKPGKFFKEKGVWIENRKKEKHYL